MKKLITGILPVLLAILLLMAGCGGTAEETGATTPESNQWLEYLRILPENDTTLAGACIQTSDLEDILRRYDAEHAQERILSVELFTFNNLQLFSNRDYSDEEWKNTLGLTVDDVTAAIVASAGPPQEYQAVYGTFTAKDIETAAKAGPLQEHLEIKSHAGYEYYSWGEDMGIHMSPEWRSNIRNLGRGHRLSYVDGFALWMIWTEGLTDMIDAYTGNIPSLADREDYQLLAAELEEMDTATAFFSADVLSVAELIERVNEHSTDQAGSAFKEAIKDEPLLKPFTSFATGAGEDEDGRFMAIIMVNPDKDTAKDNVSLLKQRINESEMYPYATNPDMENKRWTDDGAVESMDITSRGCLTIAKLYGMTFFRWKYFHYWGTLGPYVPLLLHE
ncbi:MAG: hypothetical protein A2158_02565 [Chloroflexi bacterium RBG_13_46_14]|nr:MAG: hypothetical protein A2158_02565 [Chloroflexi bacterium RBG_13_46_14]